MIRLLWNDDFSQIVQITDKEVVHHWKHVLRIKPQESVYLVNRNEIAHYQVADIDDEMVTVSLKAIEQSDNELVVQVDIAAGYLKNTNTDLVIQKAVELGVTNINLVNMKRCVSVQNEKSFNKKQSRYQKIIESAVKQSRRNIQPEVHHYQSIKDLDLSSYDLVFCPYESAENNMFIDYAHTIKTSQKILILIGPEGGFDLQEIAYLESEDVKIVTLGKRILRAETATISALAMVSMLIEGEK